MAIQIINIGDSGYEVRDALNSNAIELFSTLDKNTYYPSEGETFNNAVTSAADYESIYVNGAMLLTADVSTSKNLIFPKGSTLGGAFTLTYTGFIIAGYYQIFESELIVTGYNANKLIIVDWWGIDNTGVEDCYQSFYKAWQRMGSGFTMKVSPGYYNLILEHHNPGLRDDCVYDFNGATLNLNGNDYISFGNYSTKYGFDSNPFLADFVKNSYYIVVADKDEWLSLDGWGENVKICLTTTEIIHHATSDYYDSLCIDVDRFETVGDEDRMYFKYPCPRDFKTSNETYPLREYGDDNKVVQFWNLTKNIEWRNLKIKDGKLFFSNVYNLILNNLSFLLDEDYLDSYNAALEIIQSDLISINNFQAENYHKDGYGYGITTSSSSRLIANHLKIKDCRHAVSFGGGYDSMSYLYRITDIELINTGKSNADNNIDAHGNLIDYYIENVRGKCLERVYASRSGGGILRNIYVDTLFNSPFYFSGSAAIDDSVCGIQNAIICNCPYTIIELSHNVKFAIFENMHCDNDVTFLELSGTVDTIIINNCTVNKRPVIATDVDIVGEGSVSSLYINNSIVE